MHTYRTHIIIGVLKLELHLPAPNSLKSKRCILKKIIDRLRHKFNISISEVDYHDLWQRSLIGVSITGNEKRHLNSVIDKVVDSIEAMHDVQVINSTFEFI